MMRPPLELCTNQELLEFASICAYLKLHRRRLKCTYTARRKPKEVKLLLIDKLSRRAVASA